MGITASSESVPINFQINLVLIRIYQYAVTPLLGLSCQGSSDEVVTTFLCVCVKSREIIPNLPIKLHILAADFMVKIRVNGYTFRGSNSAFHF